MASLVIGGFSGRLRAISQMGTAARKRFRGKKAAIESLVRKRQAIDVLLARLHEEVAAVQKQWSRVQNALAAAESTRLALVASRANLLQLSISRAFAGIDTQSTFGLNACDGDIRSAVSLLSKLRLEVRVSAARASATGPKDDLAEKPLQPAPTEARATLAAYLSV